MQIKNRFVRKRGSPRESRNRLNIVYVAIENMAYLFRALGSAWVGQKHADKADEENVELLRFPRQSNHVLGAME